MKRNHGAARKGGSDGMTKKQRRLRLLLTALAVLAISALAWAVGRPMLRFVSEPERFRAWIEARGVWGVLAFALMNMLQVFAAAIPGGPFSVAAGYAFGPVRGTVICLLAATTASTLVLLAVRRWGGAAVRFLSGKEPEELALFQKLDRAELVFFLVFLIPGSPKDVLSYAAGLTRISVPSWIIINLIGRIPGILLSVLGGDRVMHGDYLPALALALFCGALYVVGMLLYRRYTDKKEK